MAISDTERQAFAQALRSLSNSSGAEIYEIAKYQSDSEIGYFTIFGIAVVAAMEDRVGLLGDSTVSGYLAALAEIIDVETCRNLAMRPFDEFLCSECGEHVDIAYVETCDDYHAKYCPNCGRRAIG